VSETRRTLLRALGLGVLAVAVAGAAHLPLIRRFVRGEFRESFFQASAYPGIRMITLQETEDLWRSGAAAVLDARAAVFYERGHVPGARNVPAGEGLPEELAGVARDRTVLVYCEGGDCQSSLALARRLHDDGFKDIRVFSGGWEAWTGAGLPEERTEGKRTEVKDDGPE
jgi:rhodanese-related sulfurtransferase